MLITRRFSSFCLPVRRTQAAGLAVPALAIQRASSVRTKALAIYSTIPRTTVIRPAVRCQATSRNEIKLEGVNGGPINVFIWRTEYRMLRHARPLVGWNGERRNRTLVTQVSMSGRHRRRRFRKSGVGIKVRKRSTMSRPTIVIWLVLLVLALTVVAFVTRLVEKYRLPDRFSRVREKPSLSPKATHPILKQQ
jgi:hypothetical protein